MATENSNMYVWMETPTGWEKVVHIPLPADEAATLCTTLQAFRPEHLFVTSAFMPRTITASSFKRR